MVARDGRIGTAVALQRTLQPSYDAVISRLQEISPDDARVVVSYVGGLRTEAAARRIEAKELRALMGEI